MTDEKEKSQLVDIEGLRAFLNKTDERYVKIGESTGVIYSLSKNNSGEIILTGSDNSVTKVTDANTTYAFTQEGTVLTITPSTGDPVTINMGEEITSEKIIEALGFTPVQQSDIPDPITESDVSSWGFTKNTGDYTKPSTGIPSTDLAKSVQDSLELANTALQSFTEKDPTVPSHVKGIKESDITSWNSKVDSVSGKGLSTNDFTNSYKSAIDNLPTSYAPVDAQKNVIEAIKVNNTALTPTDKAVNITVPTKASDIGAMANTVTHLSGDVPTSRKVNGKALTSDITLTATDVGALPDTTDLSVYSLATEAGYDLGLSIDSKTYVMTLELKNKAGTVISTKTLDFPIESMVVNATYASGKITLTLQSGQTLDVDITALVSGLVNDSFTIAGIDMKDNITAAELKTALGVPGSFAPVNAQANVIETIKVNNVSLTPSSKAVNITVPTGAAASKAVDTSISAASTSANLPTSAAVASFVEGKGYKTTDNNTTYTLTQDSTDGHKITLTPSTGTPTTITIPDNNTTYSVATTSANGLMSSSDKSKLDGIASGATANVGTITGIKMNGSSKGTSGVVDLGTVITSHQDISGKIDKTSAGLSAAINLLNTGDSTPVDNDYFISQYVNGGTTTTSYHRRPISTLWSYIKGKIGVSKGSATQPVYIDANGAIQACTYTLGKSVPSDAKFTDTTYSALTESEVTTLFNGIFK